MVASGVLSVRIKHSRRDPLIKGDPMGKKVMKKGKVEKVMHEYKEGSLHSGSKKGPKVKSRKQAVAIALSEARKAGESVKPKKGKRSDCPTCGKKRK